MPNKAQQDFLQSLIGIEGDFMRVILDVDIHETIKIFHLQQAIQLNSDEFNTWLDELDEQVGLEYIRALKLLSDLYHNVSFRFGEYGIKNTLNHYFAQLGPVEPEAFQLAIKEHISNAVSFLQPQQTNNPSWQQSLELPQPPELLDQQLPQNNQSEIETLMINLDLLQSFLIQNHSATITALLQGANPNFIARGNMSLLHLGAFKGNVQMMTALLSADEGMFINQRMDAGYTALWLAIECGHFEVTELLLESNADCNIAADNGLSPLHLAIEQRNLNLVKSLLSKGANINLSCDLGITPIFMASQHENPEILNELIAAGGDVDWQDYFGNSALHYLCQEGDIIGVKRLLDLGADINLLNGERSSPKSLAIAYGHRDLANDITRIQQSRIQGLTSPHNRFFSNQDSNNDDHPLLNRTWATEIAPH